MTPRLVRSLAALIWLGALGAAAAAAEEPLKIGLVGSFSGGAAQWGISVDAAFAAYQKQHGDMAGGRKIE